MQGFSKRVFTDHTLAAFLRKCGAINDWTMDENRTDWYTQDNRILVTALYSGERGEIVEYWVRNDMLTTLSRMKNAIVPTTA